jgi:ketosteroid isomerase-like protein
MAGGDPAVTSRFNADNALLVPADGSLQRGRAAVEAWLGREPGGNRIALDHDAAEFELAGDEAYVTGRFTTAGDPTGGRTATAGGRYVEAWRLAGGQWRLAYHTLLAESAGLPR